MFGTVDTAHVTTPVLRTLVECCVRASHLANDTWSRCRGRGAWPTPATDAPPPRGHSSGSNQNTARSNVKPFPLRLLQGAVFAGLLVTSACVPSGSPLASRAY